MINKQKILIVSRTFYPEVLPRSLRATELAKEFSRKGHDVLVLTNKKYPDYSDFLSQHNITIEDFVFGKWSEIEGKGMFIRFIRFLMNYLFLFPDIKLSFLLKKALTNRSGFDLLISLAVPYTVHWGVALAIKTNPALCRKWVADCGDPFIGNKELKRKYPFYFKYIENWFCRIPDYITVPVEEAKEAYPSFCRDKIRVIPQGFNLEESRLNLVRTDNSYPVFAYAGSLNAGTRNPSEFLEYLSTRRDLKFVFLVYTKNPQLLVPFQSRLKEKLVVSNCLSRLELLKQLSKTDFLVNFENSGNIQLPSKLIDYAIVHKPILSVSPRNPDLNLINQFLEGNYSGQKIIHNIEQYDIRNVSSSFLSLSDGISIDEQSY